MPSREAIHEDFKTYFYITRKGMDLHISDDTWWPLDDEGRQDWRLTSSSTL
jgi:hypothetical protein